MAMLPIPPPEPIIPYASEAGHWYDWSGNPVYEVPSKKGEMRPTTLRDARKLSLVPSVTGIGKLAANFGLQRWKDEQLVLATMTLPRIDGETEKQLVARILKDAEEQSIKARDTGSIIHGCIEKMLCGESYDESYSKHATAALRALETWCGLDGILAEKSFAHELGYGGKVDVHKRCDHGWVADFKTKEFDRSKLPETYDQHDMQLAAYREGFALPHARCAIIFVSTSVPGLTHLVEIGEDELTRGWNMFVRLLQFWQEKNRYQPRKDD